MELKAKLDTAQEKISEHDDKAKEIIQKEAENKKAKKILSELWDNIKLSNIISIGV